METSHRYPETLPSELEHCLLAHWSQEDLSHDPAHDLAHIRRVWRNARAIAMGEGSKADPEVLLAAVAFHDLINLPKDHPARAQASVLSGEAARPLLLSLSLVTGREDEVAHAIAAHSFSAGIAPLTLEARILQDADRLDALGAVGLARTLMVSGQLGRPLYDSEDPLAARRPPDDGRFGLDHFAVKLLRLAETMQTETGRTMAEERTAYLKDFIAQLMAEIGETGIIIPVIMGE